MTRVMKAAEGAVQVQVGEKGAVYKSNRSGAFNVEDSSHVKMMLQGGMFLPSGQPWTSRHYVCQECGFDALIRHCPNCDSETTLVKMMGTEAVE